jgi:hypothetical protein
MIGRFDDKTQGDLGGIKPVFKPVSRRADRPGVRASIVAEKPLITVERRDVGRWRRK